MAGAIGEAESSADARHVGLGVERHIAQRLDGIRGVDANTRGLAGKFSGLGADERIPTLPRARADIRMCEELLGCFAG